MSQRTLRELHVLPFQVALATTKLSKTGTPWSIMTHTTGLMEYTAVKILI
jgi:hypothetical protein